MFKSRDRSGQEGAGPGVLERTVACISDVPLDEIWATVVDPSIPMAGDDDFVEGGWLPGHARAAGAITYTISKGVHQAIKGRFFQVSVWEPPRRLVLRAMTDSDLVWSEVEWNLQELPQGVTLSGTLRVHILKRVAEAQVRSLEAALEADAQTLATRLPRSLG